MIGPKSEPSRQLIRLRPREHTFYVGQGRTVLAMGRDGAIQDGAFHGLFVHETRLLSRYRYLIDGKPPFPVALSNIEQHSWLGYYITMPPGNKRQQKDTGSGQLQEISQQSLELRLSRFVGEGMHEDVDLTNFTQESTSFRLELEVAGDFADVVETMGSRQQQGTLAQEWVRDEDCWRLTLDYQASHQFDNQGESGRASISRKLTLKIEDSESAPTYNDGLIRFQVDLSPGATWHCCLNLLAEIDGVKLPLEHSCRSFERASREVERRKELYFGEVTQFSIGDTPGLAFVVADALEQATHDLAALRLWDLDLDESAWTVAAGFPGYVALFGRDSLTVGWQASLATQSIARGTLPILADLQGVEFNDWRDEQPGRMLHEAHTGPLEVLNFNPRSRYYGADTTSGFYPVALSQLWHWTGDRELVAPLLEPAMRAINWLQQHADLDGDGFFEYKTRSDHGVTNQGWKDSGDAIVYEDGSQVEAPISTCEEQAFAYLAMLHFSEILWSFGRKSEARRLFRAASQFKKRFNDAFWMEEEGFLAMGLDSQNRQIKSIGSNAGHCLAAGIVDKSLAPRVAMRLIAEDLYSGWGIRTLSSKHPAYNPYSYHRGSVWPVEQGTFALGFMRYGLHDYVKLICRAQFRAASLFEFQRLPELFSGHPRDEDHPFPALYPFTNSPQAWSSAAPILMVQAMLGVYPYAPRNLLFVDPQLPEWLPEITLTNLRVGKAVLKIRFYRTPDGTSDYTVQDQRGKLRVIRQPSPWSLTATMGERLTDLVGSFLPWRS